MIGETNLKTLLQNIRPELNDGEFVFCTVDPSTAAGLQIAPIGQFLEREGMTLILAKPEAEANELAFTFTSRMITLNIHSSLEAVGFLSAISQKLTEQGIPTNVISAYFHDHIFVPVDRADEAIRVLNGF
jgi:hypothetical protein